MDWPVTKAYVESFAKVENVKLRKSWRINGFWGEVYRMGASMPIQYEEDNGSIVTVPLSKRQQRSKELRDKILTEEEKAELKSIGYRMKFPAKTGNLMTRWCSPYLKIMVAEAVIRLLVHLNDEDFIGRRRKKGEYLKLLVVSGERRGESSGRAKYNEMELHRTNAIKRSKRIVHQWRIVIDHSENDIWNIIKRHHILPHPCYRAGWNRCSCMMCIFSQPQHWAGIRELFPDEYKAVCDDETILGFTLDNKKNLPEFVGNAPSCIFPDKKAITEILTGIFQPEDVYTNNWSYPAGAFHGAEGGPC